MKLTRLTLDQAVLHRFSQTLYSCMEDVGSTKGALYLHDQDAQEFFLVATYGWPRGLQPPDVIAATDALPVWVHRERRAFVANDGDAHPEFQVLNAGPQPTRYLLSPVYDRGEWIGLLVQRDRVRGGPYVLERDEKPTEAICERIVAVVRDYQASLNQEAPQGFPSPWAPEPAQAPESPAIPYGADEALPVDIPPPDAAVPLTFSRFGQPEAFDTVDPIPVEIPRSEALVPTSEPYIFEALEGFQNLGGESTFLPVGADDGLGGLRLDDSRELPPEPEAGPLHPGSELITEAQFVAPRPRTGMFLPEQRTFFWETAALLTQLVAVDAVALWMAETDEIRPILAYSPYPLSSDLKQQIMAHVTFHLERYTEQDLRILTRAEWLEQAPLEGVFRTYLPVVLMGESSEGASGSDILLLFRLQNQPFSQTELIRIQQLGRILGYHLQEGRLHERYHRAFLSVSHRLLLSTESRAPDLKPHSLETAKLARNLALRLDLPSPEVEAVSIAAILHDVGTLLLDPALLTKPQPTAEELARLRSHPVLAAAFLRDFRFPFDVLSIIRHHHERFDGTGYPDGLRGEQIPMGSRIIALIEAYEVMHSGKGYKEPCSRRAIVDELMRESGGQFDPLLVAEFLPMLTGMPED